MKTKLNKIFTSNDKKFSNNGDLDILKIRNVNMDEEDVLFGLHSISNQKRNWETAWEHREAVTIEWREEVSVTVDDPVLELDALEVKM